MIKYIVTIKYTDFIFETISEAVAFAKVAMEHIEKSEKINKVQIEMIKESEETKENDPAES